MSGLGEGLEPCPGHWDTAEGAAAAAEYLSMERECLSMADMSDFALANAVYLAGRFDLHLIAYQLAAKERIRWLSAQLASRPTREKPDLAAGDIIIGDFIAQWDEAADGAMMDADTAQALAREFRRMRGLIYCPGILRCAKCDFRLVKMTLTPAGVFANEEPDACPNCNVPMWRVTWRDEANEAYAVAENQMNRAIDLESRLAVYADLPAARVHDIRDVVPSTQDPAA